MVYESGFLSNKDWNQDLINFIIKPKNLKRSIIVKL